MIEILYFSTSWCSPCKIFSPLLHQTAGEMGILVTKIDAEEDTEQATKFNVRGVPTLIIKRNGIEVKRHIGAMAKPQLINLIKSAQ